MNNCSLGNALPRISARRGQVVDLNVDFLHNGVLADPYAIRFVEIYKTSVAPHNLVATIPAVLPDDPIYPSPICQEHIDVSTGVCGTEPTEDSTPIVGKYHLPYSIPNDFQVPDVYFDLWYYFAESPCGELGTEDAEECDIDDEQYDALLLKCCHRFWVYPDEWFCNDGLQTIRFGFEPLDQKFYTPEVRPLEVGLMPLPLYDYNFNLVNPLIPFLQPTISVETQHSELITENASARMGIRQGSYRSNPWVIQYDLDTSRYLKGTYNYWITLNLPDGSTRVSRKFIFTIN
jgi:hypothetical protein